MGGVLKAAACSILYASMLASMAACSPKKPKPDDFRVSITQSAPGYDLEEFKCESFADRSQEAAGRASCTGTLSINHDLYSLVSASEFEAELLTAGIPSEGVKFFSSRHWRNMFAPSVRQGATTGFSSECSYAGVSGGWSISCRTNYNRFNGYPRSSITHDAVVKGTPEYTAHFNETVADYRRLDAAFKELKSKIERFFTVGRTVSGPKIRARITSPLTWTGDKGYLGYQSQFFLETKYEDLRERTSGTFCGYPIGSPKDDLLFVGTINSANGDSGTYIASLEFQNRSALYQNSYRGCGDLLYWDGSSWKSRYGGALNSN